MSGFIPSDATFSHQLLKACSGHYTQISEEELSKIISLPPSSPSDVCDVVVFQGDGSDLHDVQQLNMRGNALKLRALGPDSYLKLPSQLAIPTRSTRAAMDTVPQSYLTGGYETPKLSYRDGSPLVWSSGPPNLGPFANVGVGGLPLGQQLGSSNTIDPFKFSFTFPYSAVSCSDEDSYIESPTFSNVGSIKQGIRHDLTGIPTGMITHFSIHIGDDVKKDSRDHAYKVAYLKAQAEFQINYPHIGSRYTVVFKGEGSLRTCLYEGCDKKLDISSKADISRHLAAKHFISEKPNRPCTFEKCKGKTFTDRLGLARHIGAEHYNFKPYGCGLCPKLFTRDASVWRHLTRSSCPGLSRADDLEREARCKRLCLGD